MGNKTLYINIFISLRAELFIDYFSVHETKFTSCASGCKFITPHNMKVLAEETAH